MKAEYKIKKEIVLRAIKSINDSNKEYAPEKPVIPSPIMDTEEQIEKSYDDLWHEHDCNIQDIEQEFRSSYDQETNIECDWSRYHESKSVAKELNDGSWVGWTYWSGGGKHGEPDSVPWIEESYNLKITEKKLIEVFKFNKE